MIRLTILSILLLLTAGASQAQTETPKKADIFSTKDMLTASIGGVSCKDSERLDAVKRLFSDAGAMESDITIEKFDKDKIQNLVVRKKGTTDETVVIGAHYDKTDSGCGVTDNWTGVTIVAHIYRSLRPLTTKKSYIFVAFDKEEVGLKGSAKMVNALTPDQLKTMCSMVNFDSFGQGPPMALRNASSPRLVSLAEKLIKENGSKFLSVEIPGANSDSSSFREKKVPAITLSGLDGNWTNILHSSSDTVAKVNIDSVYVGYRFGLYYISKIDQARCGDFR